MIQDGCCQVQRSADPLVVLIGVIETVDQDLNPKKKQRVRDNKELKFRYVVVQYYTYLSAEPDECLFILGKLLQVVCSQLLVHPGNVG